MQEKRAYGHLVSEDEDIDADEEDRDEDDQDDQAR